MAKETKTNNYGLKSDLSDVAKRFSFNGQIGGAQKPQEFKIGHKKQKPASQLEQIFVGWGNYVKSHFVSLSPELQEMSEKRLKECDSCHMRNGGMCAPSRQGKHVVTGQMVNGCGCKLAAKALSPDSQCPLGKW
tara:strand:+ start:1269 stop:1670 length:402 start_codon:yes stop_codon:yes gene_type:complete